MAEESITAEALDALAARLDEVEVYLHLDEKRERAAELERQSAQPGFWDDAEHARAVMAELSAARDDVKAPRRPAWWPRRRPRPRSSAAPSISWS